jgi:hypothetical protein
MTTDSNIRLDDPLADLFNADPALIAAERARPELPASYRPQVERFLETCTKCRGSGRFVSYTGRILGDCFQCKGKGSKSFAQSADQRARNNANTAARKVRNASASFEAFKVAQPAVAAWLETETKFEFAVSLKASVEKFGALTEKQLAAALRCVARNAARDESRAQKIATAPELDVSAIADALNRARAKTGKRPKLFVGGYAFKFAPTTARNPNAIYVRNASTKVYQGAISGGKFYVSREADAGVTDKLVEIARDPKAAAIAHGFDTGICACCGLLLTNKDSVARGIGPICAETFGW